MKKEELYEAIGEMNQNYLTEAREYTGRRKQNSWIGFVALAACLALVAGGGFLWKQAGRNRVQQWNSGFTAEQYFTHSGGEAAAGSDSEADYAVPYAETRYFSDERAALEENGVLPVMASHPMFVFSGNYNADGSLYSLRLSWYRRGESLEQYSDLIVTAGYQEVEMPKDCILICVDEAGNVIEPSVTVTERDGIRIIARGGAQYEKTLTYQTEHGWYQIEGSFNDSFEDMVQLLDWFWEHPLPLEQFSMENGDHYVTVSRTECPEAFAGELPDFTAIDGICAEDEVTLKNGVPVYFGTTLYFGLTMEQYENGEYTSDYLNWYLDAEPDVYDRANCIGRLEDLTKEQVLSLKPVDEATTSTKIQFAQGEYVVTIYAVDLDLAWKLIESIQ